MIVGRVVVGVALASILTGCTSATPQTPPSSSSSSAAPLPVEVDAVLALLEQLTDASGGPVAAQRAVIDGAVDPGQVAAQESCGTATTTLSFEPVPARARVRPDWKPPAGTVDGQVWGIPVLMRIHSGDRIVGTDLTELHVVIAPDGTAHLPAMCIN